MTLREIFTNSILLFVLGIPIVFGEQKATYSFEANNPSMRDLWSVEFDSEMPNLLFCSTERYVRCYYLPEEECKEIGPYKDSFSQQYHLFNFKKGIVRYDGLGREEGSHNLIKKEQFGDLVYLGSTTFMMVSQEELFQLDLPGTEHLIKVGTLATFFQYKDDKEIYLMFSWPGFARATYGVESNLAKCTVME
jgi:hypothetical protein